jgi:hypothetical protein
VPGHIVQVLRQLHLLKSQNAKWSFKHAKAEAEIGVWKQMVDN